VGTAIQAKWSRLNSRTNPALATTLENWRLATEAQDAEAKTPGTNHALG
jgi:hypothetical protein